MGLYHEGLVNVILMGIGVSVGSVTSILITGKSFDPYNHFGYFTGREMKKYYKLLQGK